MPAFQMPHSFGAYPNTLSESFNSCFGKLTNIVNIKNEYKGKCRVGKNDEILKAPNMYLLEGSKA